MNLARKGKKEETLGKNKEIEKREMREGMKGKRKEIQLSNFEIKYQRYFGA